MTGPISSILNIPLTPGIRPTVSSEKTSGFQEMLEGAIQRVEHFQNNAADAVEKLMSGEGGELHTAALATQRAELAFELGLQIRNKVVQAYQEVMRMQM
jgi:flagellar hook-basal body complex protein FliE